MAQNVRLQASVKWPGVPILDKVIDSENQETRECVLVGTIYKELALRGSVLEEFKANNGLSASAQSLNNICSENDILIMEDESGRVALAGEILPLSKSLVTGLVMGVKGSILESGEFSVNEWVYYYSIDKVPTAISNSGLPRNIKPTDKYVLLVSGLLVGSSNPANIETDFAVQLLVDFLSGRLPVSSQSGSGSCDVATLASRVVCVMVAGDSLSASSLQQSSSARERQSSGKSQLQQSGAARLLDVLLAQLLTVCAVDLMPGNADPAAQALPQPPLHRSLMPLSACFSSLRRCTNPHEAALDGVVFLGHAGQPVADIARQTAALDPPTLAIDSTFSSSRVLHDRSRDRIHNDDCDGGNSGPMELSNGFLPPPPSSPRTRPASEQNKQHILTSPAAHMQSPSRGQHAAAAVAVASPLRVRPLDASPVASSDVYTAEIAGNCAGDTFDTSGGGTASRCLDILSNTLKWGHLAPTCPGKCKRMRGETSVVCDILCWYQCHL